MSSGPTLSPETASPRARSAAIRPQATVVLPRPDAGAAINDTLYTPCVCPLSSRMAEPVRASHTFAVLSQLPVTMQVPSGVKLHAPEAACVPFEFEDGGVPVRASHTFAVLSKLPVTMRVPSGLNDTLHIACVPSEFEQGGARPRVPDLRRPVETSGDDAGAVGAERHAVHRARVPFEFERGGARSARPTPSPSGRHCR